MSTWKEPTTITSRIRISLVLPRGIGKGRFSVLVTEDGMKLEAVVKWPVVNGFEIKAQKVAC